MPRKAEAVDTINLNYSQPSVKTSRVNDGDGGVDANNRCEKQLKKRTSTAATRKVLADPPIKLAGRDSATKPLQRSSRACSTSSRIRVTQKWLKGTSWGTGKTPRGFQNPPVSTVRRNSYHTHKW